MSITRYRLTDYVHLDEDPAGGWVLYDDHVAAVDAAVASTRERAYTLMEHAIRLRVEAAIRSAAQLWSCDPADCPACDCGMDDEQRTRIRTIAASDARAAMNETSGQAESDADLAGYLLGKREGVQAARDAVAALLPHYGKYIDWVTRDEAIAAIDALRGEQA